MRELGLSVTSAGSIRIVKRHVIRLGLDTAHFTGQRRWSDAQLRRAVATAYSWPELFAALGLLGSGDDKVRVRAHAARLALDLGRLQGKEPEKVAETQLEPDLRRLREAGPAIAVTWFLLCGRNAAIPVEPAPYDLLVSMPDGIKRVQVKTTTYRNADWQVQVGRRPYSVGNRGLLLPHDPEALDYFFILDGDLTMYLIPSRVIAGRIQIQLSNYSEFIVGNVGFLLNCRASAERPGTGPAVPISAGNGLRPAAAGGPPTAGPPPAAR